MRYSFSRSTIEEPVRTEIILPAFSYGLVWAGVSDLVATWEINNATEFSLKLPIDPPSDTFVLAVAWDDPDVEGLTYRYKIWDGGVLHYPIYDGERLGQNSRLEVWSVDSTEATLSEDFSLYSSWLTDPELCICTGGTPVAGIIETSDELIPDVTPPPPVTIIIEGAGYAIQGYAQLRAITGYVDNQVLFLEFGINPYDALGGNFTFEADNLTTDDNVDIIKPNDIDVADPGRWVRSNNP